ncbi:hypothetical protein EBS02_05060, partial [bacterium]|nr:hypothetical protein [bacterium]
LGVNDTTNRNTPVTTLLGGTNWKKVVSGKRHYSVIKTDGTLWLWGYGRSGGLGDNTGGIRLTPVTTLLGGNNWKDVSMGSATISSNAGLDAFTLAIQSVDYI